MRIWETKTDNTAPASGGILPALEDNTRGKELENAVKLFGITLDATTGPDSRQNMLAEAMSRSASYGLYGVTTGTANALVVTEATVGIGLTAVVPKALFTGMRVKTTAALTNGAATTANVFGLGIKKLLTYAGAACVGGELVTGFDTEWEYDATLDSAAGAWRILPWANALVAKEAHKQPIVGGVWTWSQSLSDGVETKITGYTQVQANLLDATFSSGTLTIGANTVGQWLALFAGTTSNTGVDCFASIIHSGGSIGFNTSDTSPGSAAAVSATAIPRLLATNTMQFNFRQISGVTRTATGRLHLVKVGG